VTGGRASFCLACGYQFQALPDPVRAMASRKRKKYGTAVLAGLSIAVLQFVFLR
jgi:hypothetical protein